MKCALVLAFSLVALAAAQDKLPAPKWYRFNRNNNALNTNNWDLGRLPGPEDNMNFEGISSFGDKGGAVLLGRTHEANVERRDSGDEMFSIEVASVIFPENGEIIFKDKTEVALTGHPNAKDITFVGKTLENTLSSCAANWEVLDKDNKPGPNVDWTAPTIGDTIVLDVEDNAVSVVAKDLNIAEIRWADTVINKDNKDLIKDVVNPRMIVFPSGMPNFDPSQCGKKTFGVGKEEYCAFTARNPPTCPKRPQTSTSDGLQNEIDELNDRIEQNQEREKIIQEQLEAARQNVTLEIRPFVSFGSLYSDAPFEVVQQVAEFAPARFASFYDAQEVWTITAQPTTCCGVLDGKQTSGCSASTGVSRSEGYMSCRSEVKLPKTASETFTSTVLRSQYERIVRELFKELMAANKAEKLQEELDLGFSEHCFRPSEDAVREKLKLWKSVGQENLHSKLSDAGVEHKSADYLGGVLSVVVTNGLDVNTDFVRSTVLGASRTIDTASGLQFGELEPATCQRLKIVTVEHPGLISFFESSPTNEQVEEVVGLLSTYLTNSAQSRGATGTVAVALKFNQNLRRDTGGANVEVALTSDENTLGQISAEDVGSFEYQGSTGTVTSVDEPTDPIKQTEEQTQTDIAEAKEDAAAATVEAPGKCGLPSRVIEVTYQYTLDKNGGLSFADASTSRDNSLTIAEAKATIDYNADMKVPFEKMWGRVATTAALQLSIIDGSCFIFDPVQDGVYTSLTYVAEDENAPADYNAALYTIATLKIRADSTFFPSLTTGKVKAALEDALELETVQSALDSDTSAVASKQATLASLNPSSSSGGSMMVMGAAAAAAVVIIAVIAFIIYKKRSGNSGPRPAKVSKATVDRTVVAFENPMYDDPAQSAMPMYDQGEAEGDEGLYDEPAFNEELTKQNPLYASNDDLVGGEPTYEQETGGYLDIAPGEDMHVQPINEGMYGDDPDDGGYLDQAPLEATYGDTGYLDTQPDTGIYGDDDDIDGGYLEQGPDDLMYDMPEDE